jgi:hypothetical protein
MHQASMQGMVNRATPGTSSALTLQGRVPRGALNAPSPVVAMLAPCSTGSIDQVLQEVEATLGLLPPLWPIRGHRRWPRPRLEWSRLPAAWRRRC